MKTVNSKGFYKPNVKLRMTPDGLASRGGNWADGAITWSGFNTILPPNSPSCDTGVQHRLEGVFSASSNHAGGCHILMADGAVMFMTDTIEHGNDTSKSVYQGSHAGDATANKQDSVSSHPASPYGLWGALGTRSSEPESIPQSDSNPLIDD